MPRRTQVATGFIALALLASCSSVTELVVVVDTDYAVPAELDELRVEVTGPSGMLRTATHEPSAGELPLTLTVLPSGERLGPVQIRAVGLSAGAEIASQSAEVTLQSGRSLTLRMYLSRECEGVSCASGETCVCGECASSQRVPSEWSGTATMGPCGGDPDAGVADAGPTQDGGAECTGDAQCDDGIDCTSDACVAGACESTPDDGSCTAGTGGVCIEGFGCQYDGCSPDTCVAGPCQTARCDGDECVLESSCADGEECCADACVPVGCDDGNPCTDDSCGAAGCESTPNTAACDDGVFCNGTDTCDDGTCSTHAGDPCAAPSVCDASSDRCVGCASDADCPADVLGPWGSCSYSGTCSESGTQSRTVTSYACVASVCQPSSSTEDRGCTRSTDGTSCGGTTFGVWGSCGGFAEPCGESGTRSRTRTDRVCAGGSCGDSVSTDTGSCTRNTDGSSCGSSTFTMWGACGGFMGGTCDETGTQSRTRTDFTCASGSCGTSMASESRGCTRDTDGVSCGATTYGSWGPCGGYSSICDETGTRSRSETTFTCSSGSCSSSSGTDTGTCTRNTDGDSCDSLLTCQRGTCSGGSCSLTGPSCPPLDCCEPGICVSGGGACP